MKKILFTLLILTGFAISAQAQTVTDRRTRHERRIERKMELRRLERRHRRHRRRRLMSFENQVTNLQNVVVYCKPQQTASI